MEELQIAFDMKGFQEYFIKYKIDSNNRLWSKKNLSQIIPDQLVYPRIDSKAQNSPVERVLYLGGIIYRVSIKNALEGKF